MLQDGIYWDHNRRPPPCWCAMFLRASAGADAAAIDSMLERLWRMWRELMAGRIRDLHGADVEGAGLEVLLGYGHNAFRIAGARHSAPTNLSQYRFRRPEPHGGPLLPGSGISYAPAIARNPATEEFFVQGTAVSPLGAARLIVETSKLIADETAPGADPVLQVTTAYTGFNREDHRSWIDFHDGTSNLSAGAARLSAISVKPPPAVPTADGWTTGGTYAAFVRLFVDLAGWRSLSEVQQEAAVGRKKLTGCPIINITNNGDAVPMAGCPAVGTSSVSDHGNVAFLEPPVSNSSTAPTHVQRANHHIGLSTANPDSFRIFRQGYEFLDPPQLDRLMQVGLNFVSFQDTPDRLFHILTQPGWLGDVNFGGHVTDQSPPLGTLLAAGAAAIFLVPPVIAGEAYPGQAVFKDV